MNRLLDQIGHHRTRERGKEPGRGKGREEGIHDPPEIDIFASFLSSPAGEKMAAVPVLGGIEVSIRYYRARDS